MEILVGYSVQDGKLAVSGESHRNQDKTRILKLLKNMYGLKQAGHNWYNRLTDELLNNGFQQSQVDKCLFI